MRKIDVAKFLENCENGLDSIDLWRAIDGSGTNSSDISYSALYSMSFEKKLDIPYCLYGYTTSSEKNSKYISKIPKCLYWYIVSYYDFNSERIEFKFIGVESYEALDDVIKNSLEYFGVKSKYSFLLKLGTDGVYHEDYDYYDFASDDVRFSHITGDEEIFKGLDNLSREDKIGLLKALMDDNNGVFVANTLKVEDFYEGIKEFVGCIREKYWNESLSNGETFREIWQKYFFEKYEPDTITPEDYKKWVMYICNYAFRAFSSLYKYADGYLTYSMDGCEERTEEIPEYNIYFVVPVITLEADSRKPIVGFYIKGFDELPDVDEYLKSIDSGVISEIDSMKFDEAKLFDFRREDDKLSILPYLGLAFDYNENGQPYMHISVQGN